MKQNIDWAFLLSTTVYTLSYKILRWDGLIFTLLFLIEQILSIMVSTSNSKKSKIKKTGKNIHFILTQTTKRFLVPRSLTVTLVSASRVWFSGLTLLFSASTRNNVLLIWHALAQCILTFHISTHTQANGIFCRSD